MVRERGERGVEEEEDKVEEERKYLASEPYIVNVLMCCVI